VRLRSAFKSKEIQNFKKWAVFRHGKTLRIISQHGLKERSANELCTGEGKTQVLYFNSELQRSQERYLRWLVKYLLPKLSVKQLLPVPQCRTKFWLGKPSRRHWNGSAWPSSTNNKHARNSCFGFSVVSGLATLTFYQLPDFNVRKEAVPLSKYTQLFANRWWAIWSALSNSSVQIR